MATLQQARATMASLENAHGPELTDPGADQVPLLLAEEAGKPNLGYIEARQPERELEAG